MTFDWWYCVFFAMFVIGLEPRAFQWTKSAGWIGGIGEGIFVLLALLTAVCWRMPVAPEQRKLRKLSTWAIGFGMAINLYILSFAAELSH